MSTENLNALIQQSTNLLDKMASLLDKMETTLEGEKENA